MPPVSAAADNIVTSSNDGSKRKQLSERTQRPWPMGEMPQTLRRYKSSDTAARYFCGMCGTCLWMHYGDEDGPSHTTNATDDSGTAGKISMQKEEDVWFVTTGSLELADAEGEAIEAMFKVVSHIYVEDTKDGGVAVLAGHSLPNSDATKDATEIPSYYRRGSPRITRSELISQLSYASTHINPHTNERENPLVAQCHCRTVTLLISPPDIPSSYPPEAWNAWAEALDPPPHNRHAHTHSTSQAALQALRDSEVTDTPKFDDRDVWWLRPSLVTNRNTGNSSTKRNRLLVATCACDSCRRGSGTEVQQWVFTPTGCISVVLRPSSARSSESEDTEAHPVTVPWSAVVPHLPVASRPQITSTASASFPEGYSLPFEAYESSPGTHRGFCGTCGATIFWSGKQHGEMWPEEDRRNTIDISAGLVSGAGTVSDGASISVGSRRDEWLDWRSNYVTNLKDYEAKRRGDLGRRIQAGARSEQWLKGLGGA